MNPKTWREMVDRSNELYNALGDGVKRIEGNEKDASVVQRRSLRATRDLKAGHVITEEDMEALRPIPQDGIPPYELKNIVGKTLSVELKKGEHISYKNIQS